jgi:hypothetical protein
VGPRIWGGFWGAPWGGFFGWVGSMGWVVKEGRIHGMDDIIGGNPWDGLPRKERSIRWVIKVGRIYIMGKFHRLRITKILNNLFYLRQ